MEFWLSTLSSAIGALVGIVGALWIARWQSNKSHRLNNAQFYMQFNEAQIYINKFEEKMNKIIKYTEEERKHARIFLDKNDFKELRTYLEEAIKKMNIQNDDFDLDNFVIEFGKINQAAPLDYYKDLNFILLSMAIIYNMLLFDCRNLVHDLPDRIKMLNFEGVTLRFILKKFRRRYGKLQRELKL
jgi:hypothetical protein